MSRTWWPFWRRSGKSKQSKVPEVPGKKDQRQEETRRIARHLAREAYFAEEPKEPESRPEPKPKGPTVTVYGELVHVNFHVTEETLQRRVIDKKDPITRKIKRVARRFDRSDVFYTKDGRLIDDENPPDDPKPLTRH